jgi:GrpB-like predicted nucleotidyltransferase (UPF0157 family)
MIIGLKRGVIGLANHDSEWETLASQTIEKLRNIFGSIAIDIQHIGSTSIPGIMAKPIIDIAVAVENFKQLELLIPMLEKSGFLYRGWFIVNRIMVLNAYNEIGHTHHVHIVKVDSKEWNDHINFRDYLKAMPLVAKEYEKLKIELSMKNRYDPERKEYAAGKHDFVRQVISDAEVWKKKQQTV